MKEKRKKGIGKMKWGLLPIAYWLLAIPYLAYGDINVPRGFEVKVFAENIINPTSMAFDQRGRLFVCAREGNIKIFEDTDNDGSADVVKTFATGFIVPLGIAFRGNDLYVSDSANVGNTGKIIVLQDTDGDDVADVRNDIITDLPVIAHRPEGIAFGPVDGKLYFTLGSSCDACDEADPRSATILRADPDGSNLEVFAKGLRNAYDLVFNKRGHLFATDNGRDDLGNDEPLEELNHIIQGGDYGWPNCWDNNTQKGCEGKIKPIAKFPAHSSANGLTFYSEKQFPRKYRRNLFIAQWGTDRFLPPKGQKVVRVRLIRSGNTYITTVRDFATGLDRPLDVVVGPDGSLFVADYGANTIYKISYTGRR